jgi:formylglycine-generating enzyme
MLRHLAALRLPDWLVMGAGRVLQAGVLVLPLGALALAWWEEPAEPTPLRPQMVRIEAGSFTMGSPVDEADRQENEGPVEVTITSSFWMARTEVTQAMYQRVMGEAPFYEEFEGVGLLGADLPAQGVSWVDALRYCNRLSELEGFTPVYDLGADPPVWNEDADGYRLPTEAEWEFAARAGSATTFAGTGSVEQACGWGNYGDQAFDGKFPDRTVLLCNDGFVGLAPVGSFSPNAWWLYDTGGNVFEWVWDGYLEGLSGGQNPVVDAGVYRVIRGGSWDSFPRDARVANRRSWHPSNRLVILGFRPARSADR